MRRCGRTEKPQECSKKKKIQYNHERGKKKKNEVYLMARCYTWRCKQIEKPKEGSKRNKTVCHHNFSGFQLYKKKPLFKNRAKILKAPLLFLSINLSINLCFLPFSLL